MRQPGPPQGLAGILKSRKTGLYVLVALGRLLVRALALAQPGSPPQGVSRELVGREKGRQILVSLDRGVISPHRRQRDALLQPGAHQPLTLWIAGDEGLEGLQRRFRLVDRALGQCFVVQRRIGLCRGLARQIAIKSAEGCTIDVVIGSPGIIVYQTPLKFVDLDTGIH